MAPSARSSAASLHLSAASPHLKGPHKWCGVHGDPQWRIKPKCPDAQTSGRDQTCPNASQSPDVPGR
eukprot:2181846-Prymnesium_polylepis.2